MYIVPVMESEQLICLLTILFNWKMRVGREFPSSADCTNMAYMANSGLVSSVSLSEHQETNTDTSNAGSASKPQLRNSPSDQSRISESSRVACIRKFLTTEGIHMAIIK